MFVKNFGNRDYFICGLLLIFVSACGKQIPIPSGGSRVLSSDKNSLSLSLLKSKDLAKEQWADLNKSQFQFTQQSLKNGTVSEPDFIESSEKITKELQAWVNAFHNLILGELADGDKVPNIPRPNVVLNKSSEIGARVINIDVCIDVKVAFPQATLEGQNIRGKALAMNNYQRKLESTLTDKSYTNDFQWSTTYRCLPKPYLEAQSKAMLRWWFAQIPNCEAIFESDLVKLSSECSADLAAQRFGGEQIILTQMSNWIEFDRGTFEVSTEEYTLATLMHELGHYYMNHTYFQKKDYEIFYDLDSKTVATLPTVSSKHTVIDNIINARDVYLSDSSDLAKKQAYKAAIEQGDDESLGFYTVEEEADDLGLEWLTAIGIEPNVAARNMLNILAAAEKKHSDFVSIVEEVDSAKCTALFYNGFIGSDGKKPKVTIGNYHEPHHSLCFRVSNIVRQIELYKYQRAPKKLRELMSDADWQVNVKSLLMQ